MIMLATWYTSSAITLRNDLALKHSAGWSVQGFMVNKINGNRHLSFSIDGQPDVVSPRQLLLLLEMSFIKVCLRVSATRSIPENISKEEFEIYCNFFASVRSSLQLKSPFSAAVWSRCKSDNPK